MLYIEGKLSWEFIQPERPYPWFFTFHNAPKISCTLIRYWSSFIYILSVDRITIFDHQYNIKDRLLFGSWIFILSHAFSSKTTNNVFKFLLIQCCADRGLVNFEKYYLPFNKQIACFYFSCAQVVSVYLPYHFISYTLIYSFADAELWKHQRHILCAFFPL